MVKLLIYLYLNGGKKFIFKYIKNILPKFGQTIVTKGRGVFDLTLRILGTL
jgi:hypothetical protein